MVEKVRPLKCELSKKLEDEEEKMKQFKIYSFREFPYCFFSVKEFSKKFIGIKTIIQLTIYSFISKI
jgi:hypothetical protein